MDGYNKLNLLVTDWRSKKGDFNTFSPIRTTVSPASAQLPKEIFAVAEKVVEMVVDVENLLFRGFLNVNYKLLFNISQQLSIISNYILLLQVRNAPLYAPSAVETRVSRMMTTTLNKNKLMFLNFWF